MGHPRQNGDRLRGEEHRGADARPAPPTAPNHVLPSQHVHFVQERQSSLNITFLGQDIPRTSGRTSRPKNFHPIAGSAGNIVVLRGRP